MKRRLLFILPLAGFAILTGFFVWGLQPDRDPRLVPSVMVDKEIPDFDFPDEPLLEREGFTKADLTQGRPVVINFFASWCVPCRAEHPLLTELAEKHKAEIWGINHRDRPKEAKRFLDELGNPYRRIGVDNGRGIIHWGVYGLPETMVVDGAGKIRYHHRGPLTRKNLIEEVLPVLEYLEP